jgi:hypothetical protein
MFVITDYGPTELYLVQDGLDQGETYAPLGERHLSADTFLLVASPTHPPPDIAM